MAKTYQLTWNSGQKRWFKKYRGRQYAVSPKELGAEPTKEASYGKAVEWWNTKKAELDAIADAPSEVDVILQGMIDRATAAEKALESPIFANLWESDKHKIRVLFNRHGVGKPSPATRHNSLSHHIAAYKKKSERDSGAGLIAPSRYQKIVGSLTWIEKFFAAEDLTNTEQLKAATVDAFYAWLFAHVKGKKIGSLYTARDHWQVFRVFVEWLAENEVVAMPFNLKSRRFKWRLPKPKYEYWTAEGFQACYVAANDRMKLFLLLIANCGFYPSDIAALKKAELNLKAGTITRQRTKTGDDIDDRYEASSEVPTVTYFLWPETLAALKQHMSGNAILALTNSEGKPLWIEGIKDGKHYRNNDIKNAYRYFQRTHPGIAKNTLANIRKTSTQFLSDSEFRDVANHFGGWAENSVREKHYTEVSAERFAAALEWLRTAYGFDKKKPSKPVTPTKATKIKKSKSRS